MQELNILEWSYAASLTVCEYALKIVLTGFFIALHVWAIGAALMIICYGSVLLFRSLATGIERARCEAETIRTTDPRYRRY